MKIGVSVLCSRLFVATAFGDIGFTADNRSDCRLLGGTVEVHRAVHDAVVRHGNRRHTGLNSTFHNIRNTAGAVEHAVGRVQVKMDEGLGRWGGSGNSHSSR